MDELYPYQIEGADFLAQRSHALLADEMGLGKSAQAVRASDLVNARRIVVLCPASARTNWLRQFDRWSPFGRPATGIYTSKDTPLADGVTVCSYDLATEPSVLRALRNLRPDVVVADEAHFLKSHSAQRTKAILGKEGLVHAARRVWAMSGTPAPNHPAELWVWLYVLGAYSGSYDSFVRRFCTGYRGKYDFKFTGGKNYAELRRLLAPIMLRRKKTEVMDLPMMYFEDYTIEPGDSWNVEDIWFPEFLRHPERKIVLEQEEDKVRAALAAAKDGDLTAALASVGGAVATLRRYTGLLKVFPYIELVKSEMESGLEKLIIFCYHRYVIVALREYLRAYRPITLYGGTPALKRQKYIDRFIRKGKHRIALLQIQAAGTALDGMQDVCHHVDFLEPDWVPGNNVQAANRVHRIGQQHPVRVRFIGMAGSLDEMVSQTLRRKTETLSQIFD